MVQELSYETVVNVVESWESLRRIENYQEKAGVLLYQNFFRLEPRAVKAFSFGKLLKADTQLNDEFFKSPPMVRHAKLYIQAMDRAVGLLGPDIELLTEIMENMGKSHYQFGVEASFYPPMGMALICTLETLLADQYKPAVKDAWLEVYQALSMDMVRAKKLQN